MKSRKGCVVGTTLYNEKYGKTESSLKHRIVPNGVPKNQADAHNATLKKDKLTGKETHS